MSKFDDYIKTRDRHDKKLKNDRISLSNDLDELEKVIDIFSGKDRENSLISHEVLNAFDFDKWYNAGKGVRFKRIKDGKKPLYFITEMNPSLTDDGVARFGVQEHDCKEIVTIIKGELIEPFEQNKNYVKDEIVIYPENYKHKPFAREESVYLVEFIK